MHYTQSPSLLPLALQGWSLKSEAFVKELMVEHGVHEKTKWHNNNSTVVLEVYVLDVDDVTKVPGIYKRVFEFNCTSGEPAVTVVPVAGKKPKVLPSLTNIAEESLDKEYSQSFSLNPIAAKGATILLRMSKKVQKTIEIVERDGRKVARVPASAKITDIDKFLFKMKYALPPNMPTLHVCTAGGGVGNGCVGSTRDLGPMSTSVVGMEIVDPRGNVDELSATKRTRDFEVLSGCNLGVCFVSHYLFTIEKRFLMKRRTTLLQNMAEFAEMMLKNNKFEKEHVVIMYIPVDINKTGDHLPRIRVTEMERTADKPKKPKSQAQKDICDYLDLIFADLGNLPIELVTEVPALQSYFNEFLGLASVKTYGTQKETVEIDYSANITHIFGSYTSRPIADYCWFIPVKNAGDALKVSVELGTMIEDLLIEQGSKDVYRLLNFFIRFIKGIEYPEKRGGIAPAAVDGEYGWVISFELVSFEGLAKTPEFKQLVKAVIEHLKTNYPNYKYHPGKTLPDDIRSITQYMTSDEELVRIQNFHDTIYTLHGGKGNIQYSPTITELKSEFIGFKPLEQKQEFMEAKCIAMEEEKESSINTLESEEKIKKALYAFHGYAEKHGINALKEKVSTHLKQL